MSWPTKKAGRSMIVTARLDEETYASLWEIAKSEGQPPDVVAARLLTAAVYDLEEQ